MARSKSNAMRIRAFLATNPDWKPAEVAKKFNVNPAYIYVLRSQMKKAGVNIDSAHTGTKIIAEYTAPKAPAPDMVNHPPHYTTGGIETIDFIEAKGLDYHLGNVVKYVTRAGKKADALEDLRKAQWYLNRAVAAREPIALP